MNLGERREAPEIVCIGEAMALVVPADAESLVDAVGFRLDVAGAELNVATHLAALGHASAWVSRLGNDPLGRRIRRQVAERGVDGRWIAEDAEAPTGAMVKDPGRDIQYLRAGSAASRLDASDIADAPLASARVVHLSGITPALSPSCEVAVDAALTMARAAGVHSSFDVNYRARLWSDGRAANVIARLANRADIVFVGLDEAQAVWGVTTAEQVRELLPEPRHLVVKDGARDAVEFGPEGVNRVAALQVSVVEPIGAGDAFAAGYLHAFLRRTSPAARLGAGHHAAALALGTTSDVPESYTEPDLEGAQP